MGDNQQLGASGESAAANYLQDKGLRLRDRNVRTRYGEIDLLMTDGAELVFVEVKTRRHVDQGEPQEAVGFRKLMHTVAAANTYIMDTQYDGAWRVDVVAITPDKIEHLRNVTAQL